MSRLKPRPTNLPESSCSTATPGCAIFYTAKDSFITDDRKTRTAPSRRLWLCYQSPLRRDFPLLPIYPQFPSLPYFRLRGRPQLLDHRHANRIDDFVRVLRMKVVVVSKDGEQEPLAANCRRVT